MSDYNNLVDRLRMQALHDGHSSDAHVKFCADVHAAADEILRLQKLVEEMTEALYPFAQADLWDIGEDEAVDDLYKPMPPNLAVGPVIRVGHFMAAYDAWSKALSSKEETK